MKANSWEFFDQDYCEELSTHEDLIALVDPDKPWSFYKDLDKVWQAEFCKGRFSKENTLIIDTSDYALQLYKKCSLIVAPYKLENIEVEGDQTLSHLTTFIESLLESADDVPNYLATAEL